jgi:hypothetical protein
MADFKDVVSLVSCESRCASDSCVRPTMHRPRCTLSRCLRCPSLNLATDPSKVPGPAHNDDLPAEISHSAQRERSKYRRWPRKAQAVSYQQRGGTARHVVGPTHPAPASAPNYYTRVALTEGWRTNDGSGMTGLVQWMDEQQSVSL